MNKIIIIGCGNVGLAYAYSLISQKFNVKEIILIDPRDEKTKGEAMDLNHASVINESFINFKYGTYKDCENADLICITAGNDVHVNDRDKSLDNNLIILKEIIKNIKKTSFKGFYLIATNPVDIITYYTQKLTNQDPNKVIGTGTLLDTARYKFITAQKLNINPDDVKGFFIGQHGKTGFITWSKNENNIDENDKKLIESKVISAAFDIIKRKQNTSYGIGTSLAFITKALTRESATLIPISCFDEKENIYYSYPAYINKNGVIGRKNLNLNENENEKLLKSINKIKKLIEDENK